MAEIIYIKISKKKPLLEINLDYAEVFNNFFLSEGGFVEFKKLFVKHSNTKNTDTIFLVQTPIPYSINNTFIYSLADSITYENDEYTFHDFCFNVLDFGIDILTKFKKKHFSRWNHYWYPALDEQGEEFSDKFANKSFDEMIDIIKYHNNEYKDIENENKKVKKYQLVKLIPENLTGGGTKKRCKKGYIRNRKTKRCRRQ